MLYIYCTVLPSAGAIDGPCLPQNNCRNETDGIVRIGTKLHKLQLVVKLFQEYFTNPKMFFFSYCFYVKRIHSFYEIYEMENYFLHRYRKVLSNNCKEGGRNVYSPRRQACRPRAPQGLRVTTTQGELSTPVGSNVSFLVYLDNVSFIWKS